MRPPRCEDAGYWARVSRRRLAGASASPGPPRDSQRGDPTPPHAVAPPVGPSTLLFPASRDAGRYFWALNFAQSDRKLSSPRSVRECLNICSSTLKGMVQMSAPINAACSTVIGLRTLATMISVLKS